MTLDYRYCYLLTTRITQLSSDDDKTSYILPPSEKPEPLSPFIGLPATRIDSSFFPTLSHFLKLSKLLGSAVIIACWYYHFHSVFQTRKDDHLHNSNHLNPEERHPSLQLSPHFGRPSLQRKEDRNFI